MITRFGHVLIAADKFKGSLTAAQVAEHLSLGLRQVVPGTDIAVAPVADGGEGTIEAALASGYTPLLVTATAADGSPVRATVATRDGTAVVELAQASGLQHVNRFRRQPLATTSFGTGQLIRAALDAGCHTIVLGLGGSACTDGGAGLVQALGVRLLDRQGESIRPGGGALEHLERIDLSGLDERVSRTRFIVASDVDNVLLGPEGAAAVFGPQKGASPVQVGQLEAGLARWPSVVTEAIGQDLAVQPGAGAAGGVGFAAMAVLRAELRPGVELLLEMIDFPELLAGATVVITGEGSLDRQSLGGKLPTGVARAAGRAGVPTIAVAGVTSLSSEALTDAGFAQTYTLQAIQPNLRRCMVEAGSLLSEIGQQVARDWLSPEPIAATLASHHHERTPQ